MNSFYVYVIQEVKASSTAPIKIGVSNHVQRRFECVQCGNPRPLEIRTKFGPMSRVQAYALERHMHFTLSSYRLRGEWFSGKALREIFKGPPRAGFLLPEN